MAVDGRSTPKEIRRGMAVDGRSTPKEISRFWTTGVRTSVSVFLDLEMVFDDEDDAEEEELELDNAMRFVIDERRR